ncbi:uncharacterized protein DUF111 [Hydrogenoanaerobacterium saccharovorans]|uniref:TIGR00299 family protein n=1 Tax=Hydrogenoanaerobacterium saccharovorans TaxID=474960 RepID=A0A1H7YWW1_9FIRM|nr:LarC family nickel insertion protein [Hydrogenoanaerobacterium saccharovorans]RPF49009.1 uncharacterized protein DUF111 [Hydrogenoanaerobacterium saccharovorans]SEM49649.1 hypothetical protein SAMN05216180_0249 [Hydrogenoanaerobacterium saccharovorans]
MVHQRKSTSLFFDCAYGISGDMTLGALLNLGVPLDLLRHELSKLPIGGYKLLTREVERYGVYTCKLDVILDWSHCDNQCDRTLKEILIMIENSQLSSLVKQWSSQLLLVLAQAEAAAHQIPLYEVCFHEKGAVDTIIDFVGTAICVEYLAPTRILSTPLNDGIGFIKCRCGIIPVPVPAVKEITMNYAIPVSSLKIESELVTPTGAAIAAVFFSQYLPTPPHNHNVLKIGAGSGDYDYGTGGYLKCSMIES